MELAAWCRAYVRSSFLFPEALKLLLGHLSSLSDHFFGNKPTPVKQRYSAPVSPLTELSIWWHYFRYEKLTSQ